MFRDLAPEIVRIGAGPRDVIHDIRLALHALAHIQHDDGSRGAVELLCDLLGVFVSRVIVVWDDDALLVLERRRQFVLPLTGAARIAGRRDADGVTCVRALFALGDDHIGEVVPQVPQVWYAGYSLHCWLEGSRAVQTELPECFPAVLVWHAFNDVFDGAGTVSVDVRGWVDPCFIERRRPFLLRFVFLSWRQPSVGDERLLDLAPVASAVTVPQ